MLHRTILVAMLSLLSASCTPEVPTTTLPPPGSSSSAHELRQAEAFSGEDGGQLIASETDTGVARIVHAKFETNNSIQMALSDFSIKARLKSCETLMETLIECAGGADLQVFISAFENPKELHVDAFYLNPRAALYRGPLDGSYRKDHVSIIVSDVNGDGIEDLAVQAGRDGSYGSYSYEIYLYDKKLASYTLSKSFSNLTVGHLGMFVIKDGKIVAFNKSGCCVHIDKTYVVENNAPKLIEVVTETITNGSTTPDRTVQRFVEGKLQVVQE